MSKPTPSPAEDARPKRQRGEGSLRLRSHIWQIRYSYRGRPYEESSHSEKEGVARKLLRKRLGEIAAGRWIAPDAERTTFEDLASGLEENYKVNARRSLGRAKAALAHLRDVFGLARAVEITPDRLDRYVNLRMEAGASRATVRYELATLRRAFRLAHRAGKVVSVPPFPTLSPSDPRQGFFEPDDLAAILRHLPDPLKPVMQFAYLTGWRKQEILKLTWAQVDFAAGVLRLEPGTTKNREGRTFPFRELPQLETLLKAQRERTTAIERARQCIVPYVFHRNGKPIKHYDTAWRNARKKAGLPGHIVHDFRRTAARNLVRAGVPERVAMMLTGHKTRAVFDRYAIVNEQDLSEGVRKLAAKSSWTVRGQSAASEG